MYGVHSSQTQTDSGLEQSRIIHYPFAENNILFSFPHQHLLNWNVQCALCNCVIPQYINVGKASSAIHMIEKGNNRYVVIIIIIIIVSSHAMTFEPLGPGFPASPGPPCRRGRQTRRIRRVVSHHMTPQYEQTLLIVRQGHTTNRHLYD